MRAIDLLGGTEIASEDDCWEMLRIQSIGRIAVASDSRVDVFPVNFSLDNHSILIRTNAGRKLSWARDREVAFEVDSFDPRSRSGWSVVVHGSVTDLTDRAAELLATTTQPWTGEKDFLLQLVPSSISGRRIAPAGWLVR